MPFARSNIYRLFSVFSLSTVLWAGAALAETSNAAPSACNAPTLPVTGTRIVNVSTETQLQTAMSNLQPGDTIVLANGTYNLSRTLYVNGKNNVTIRGASGCDGVVLVGKGMDNATYGSVPNGVWSNSLNTTVAHLTIRDTWENELLFNAGAQAPHVYSVKLLNSGSQFIKANPTDAAAGIGVDNGIVEYSWIEYTAGTPSHPGNVGYTNGISAHTSDNWIIRGNVFKNIHNPDGSPYPWNPAILMWNRSANTTTENNTFINVDRAISYGLTDRSATGSHDHSGGVIRNNFIYLAPGFFSATRKAASDATIIVWDSPESDVYNNTLLTNGNVNRSIEFRFTTTGAEARNNLADAPIGLRDGGTAVQGGNYLSGTASMFVNPATANLHLLDNAATRTNVIDKVSVLSRAPTDIDGESRPSGTATDIGADELVLASQPVDTAPVVTAFGLPATSTSLTVPVNTFTATDDVGVTGYQITETASAPAATSAGWSASPPASFTFGGTGARTAYAWAKDAAGNVSAGKTASVTITLAQPATDTVAPTVSITSPANGATVRRTISVAVSAADNTGVTKVELYIDGTLYRTLTAPPYTFGWNTRQVPTGNHVLMAKAYDAANNSTTATITVNVSRGR